MSKKITLKECQSLQLDMLLFVDKICEENDISYWIDGGSLLGAVRYSGFIPWDDDIDFCLLYPDYLKLLNILEHVCLTHEFYTMFYRRNNLEHWCDYLGDTRVLAHGMLPIRIDVLPVKAIENTDEAKIEDKSLMNIAGFFIKGKFKNEAHVLQEHREIYLDGFKDLDSAKKAFFSMYNNYMKLNTVLGDKFIYTYAFNDLLVKKTRRYYAYDELFPLKPTKFEGHDFYAPHKIDSYLKVLYGENYMQPPPKTLQVPYVDRYVLTKNAKNRTELQTKIFLEREVQHSKARSQTKKIMWYKFKFVSFLEFTFSCFQNRAFVFWVKHLGFVVKKMIFKPRF